MAVLGLLRHLSDKIWLVTCTIPETVIIYSVIGLCKYIDIYTSNAIPINVLHYATLFVLFCCLPFLQAHPPVSTFVCPRRPLP